MITVLMASFNGEKYIKEQIDSILAQTEQDFTLFINDDCSTDRTYEIISEYAAKYPGQIIVSRNDSNSGNSKYNFMKMMTAHRDDYVMLCDQDDFWLPEKISLSLDGIREMEKKYGQDTPLLAYTDLKVADERLNVIHESMMKSVAADFSRNTLRDQLVQNTLTGCTAIYNRALADKLVSMPAFTVMHDWWLMLAAVSLGHAGCINAATILYRQHGDNSVGTRNMHSPGFLVRFSVRSAQIRRALNETYDQAESLLIEFGSQMSASDCLLVKKYAEIKKKNKPLRILSLIRLHTWKQGLVRIIGQIIYC